jgi:hypothetical protein
LWSATCLQFFRHGERRSRGATPDVDFYYAAPALLNDHDFTIAADWGLCENGVYLGFSGGTVNSDFGGTDSGDKGDRTAGAGHPSMADAAGRRAQAACDQVAAAGREASELVTEAAFRARAVALPSLARAREGSIRRWSEIDPDVKEQVALSLLTSAAVAAGEHLKEHERPGVRLLGVGLAAAAPAIVTQAVRQFAKRRGCRQKLAGSSRAHAAPVTTGPVTTGPVTTGPVTTGWVAG